MRVPAISESEWIIASVVWDKPGLTAVELAARLPATVRWKLKTVNTFLTRLVEKGVLRTERDGRAFRYEAVIPRELCVRAESRSFLQRVFGGAVAPLVAHFCESGELTERDLAELRRILQERAPRKTRGRK